MINESLISKVIYDNNQGTNGQIDFDPYIIVGKKYRIHYYYYNGTIKSYNTTEFVFPSAINLYLEASICVSGSSLLKEVRGVYITRDKLINSRTLLITFSSNGCSLSSDNPGNVYITRIEQID